jgi:hypothetical protein
LGNLKEVGRDFSLAFSVIKSLGKLKCVYGDLDLSYSEIESLGELEYVGGSLSLQDSPLGERLISEMSEDEIKNKFGVKGNLYI